MFKTSLKHLSIFTLTRALRVSSSLNDIGANALADGVTPSTESTNLLGQQTLDDSSYAFQCFDWVVVLDHHIDGCQIEEDYEWKDLEDRSIATLQIHAEE